MASKEQSEPIYEARFEEMVTPSDVKTTLRLARFLNPLSKHPNQDTNFPPLLSEIFPHDLQQWPSKVIFRGWYGHMLKWKQWVLQLSPKYSPIWTKAGIHQAIMASVYEVKSNPDTVVGLSEFWCPNTNTFLFPWGEATITLEDVMILGGCPVLGDPVTSPILTEELAQIEDKFKKYRLKILKNKGIKATHHGWLNYFMELKKESRGDLVHVAFLSIWLSRFVFPSVADKCIVNSLIPIAVKLSQGIKLALGPAVLASLYHNLTFLREQAFVSSPKINVSGPFQLLQIWALERFPIIGPISANMLRPGEPRMARWDKLTLKLNLPLVRLAVKEAKNFLWRPYAAKLENWCYPSYYEENEQSYSDCSSLDDELRSFYRFLFPSELVGMDCKEMYFPHRVAMQFGLDQDVPVYRSNMNFISSEPVKLFVPSRSFQPGVSLGYSNWWKGLMLVRECKIKEVLLGKDRDRKNSGQVLSSVQENGRSHNCHATVAAMNQIDPESQASTDSSFEIPPREVSPEVPFKFKGNRSANNDNAVRGDWDEPVVERNQTEFCTTPENLKRSSSTVTPPPGFQKSSFNAKKRPVHEFSNSDVHGSASLPCAKNAKVPKMGKELPMSNRVKTCQDGIPDYTSPLNLVKREDSSDDDVVIISHFNKKEASLLEACNRSQNAASSTIGAGSASKRERSSTGESLEVPNKTLKKFNRSSVINGEAKIADIRPVYEASKEVEEDVFKYATKDSAFPREVKVEAGDTTSEPFYVGDVKMGVGKSVKIPGASKLAGESPSNPINLDEDDTASPSGKCQKHEQSLEERIQKLEKLFGLV